MSSVRSETGVFTYGNEFAMRCLSCDHENQSGASHCGGCGLMLPKHCAACDHSNPAVNRFCDACGVPLGGSAPVSTPVSTPASARDYTPAHLAEKILTMRSVLEGERKLVTVLFCDIANSTALANRIGAEAMHSLLNAFFELAGAQVHRYEGTINQFLGDGFMALFGAPLAHEDHVRRALLAASGICQRLKQAELAGNQLLSALRVRMGVNTGNVVVGKIGDNLRMDYTAVGDTTNLAARLQGLAQPGLVYVSEPVAMAGQAYFDFRALGARAIKGISEPVEVHELGRARAREHSDSRALGERIVSTMVGRDPEQGLLLRELTELRRGKGGVVVVAGEPGSGKSRLLAETRQQIEPGSLLWLEGRAVSFGRSLSYWPFIEILKNCFDIDDNDAEDESWRKLEQGVGALFAARAPELLPYFATVLSLQLPPPYADRVKHLDGQGLRRQVFMCMRQLFEQLALRQPLLLLLEDWHWADQSSIELAEHLLPLTLTTPLLMLFVLRPDALGPATAIRQFATEQRAGRFHDLSLEPMSKEHSAALLSNLVGALDLPVALREQILHKTEGNPYFIEEVIRSLVAEGYLAQGPRGRALRLSRPVDQVQLPDTLQGLILASIDRLDDEVKQVLKLASVIGRSFFQRVLVAICESGPRLELCLTDLKQAELIRLHQRAPEIEYIFKHALVQEAAYGSILAERRRSIHQRVAEALEALFAARLDEITSLLAYHYTHAEDWEKAQEYLFKAGDQADHIAANTEALEHFRQAEAAYVRAFGDKLSPMQRAVLARKIGSALYGTGHYEQGLEQFRRALSHLGLVYPTTPWGVRRAILSQLGAHLVRSLRRKLGLPTARDMDITQARELSTICNLMSWTDYMLNRERMLLDSLLELRVGELSLCAVAEARGLSSVGFGFMTLNLRGVARNYHLRADRVARRSDSPLASAFAWVTAGHLEFSEGRWDDSDTHFSQAAHSYRLVGDIHGWGGSTAMHLFVIYYRGDLARAAAHSGELLRVGLESAEPQVATWGYQNQGWTMLARGPLDGAEDSLSKGLALARKISSWQNQLFLLGLLGKCLVLQGRTDEAAAMLDEAMLILKREGLSNAFDQVDVLTGMASVRLVQAERLDGGTHAAPRRAALEVAARACQAALKATRRMPAWLPEALRLQGRLEWLRGNAAAAQKNWHESLALAQQFAFPIELARTQLEMGQGMGNAELIEQAIQGLRQAGAAVDLAFGLHHLARCQADQPSQAGADPALTLHSFDQAIQALQDVGARHQQALACQQRDQLRDQVEPRTETRA